MDTMQLVLEGLEDTTVYVTRGNVSHGILHIVDPRWGGKSYCGQAWKLDHRPAPTKHADSQVCGKCAKAHAKAAS